jgi:hypothetical protein
MATLTRQVLNAQGMKLNLFCGGMSRVGINLSGTWTGTVSFKGSFDGVNFVALSVTPFASGTTVQSATGNGNWFVDVQNYLVIQVVFTTLTTGTATVTMASAVDASWQEAFLSSTSVFINQAASNATNTVTVASQANRAWRCRTLTITIDKTATWASSPNFQITDGASSILWAGDLPTTPGVYNVGLPADPGNVGISGGGVVGTPGNPMSIITAASGSGTHCNINAELIAA